MVDFSLLMGGQNIIVSNTQRQWKVTSIEISIFRKIYNTALWLLLVHVSGQRQDGLVRWNNYTGPGTVVHVMHVHFMFFAVFKNLKSSFSEDNMPGHALDIFIENATEMV